MTGSPGGGDRSGRVATFAARHRIAIGCATVALCLAGAYAAVRMPSSVFPRTDFPRCVILVDSGVMPADEMMATVTRPIEEAMKDIPGAVTVRSSTGRGSAEINVFFDWQVDMIQSELYVNTRLDRIRSQLPREATATVWRLTFNAFPILGISLTAEGRGLSELWEMARYEAKPRLLRVPGVARVDLVGGRVPEVHVVVDPLKLAAAGIALSELGRELERNNLIAPAGLQEQDYRLYLTVVDGRLRNLAQIEALPIRGRGEVPVRLGDVARVERGEAPAYNVVTADGRPAVLLNIRSQPNGSILEIAKGVRAELVQLDAVLPSDVRLAYYYDQSTFVRSSVGSVWEAILIGLLLSGLVLFAFLRHWGSTITSLAVIPITVLITLVPLRLLGLTFNLMTLGGIAAAIGLVIDDAIVVVEAIYTKVAAGLAPRAAIAAGVEEITVPLVASTMTPVVVFAPLAFLDGVTGVFFRALATTMVVALLTSLLLALTVTPSLASWLVRAGLARRGQPPEGARRTWLARGVESYELVVGAALRHRWMSLVVCALIVLAGAGIYRQLDSDFLPAMDEGGFVIDYHSPWGTSLEETDRQLRIAEEVLRAQPDVESYSRRTGARLALAIAEPNTGDYLVKLRPDRRRSTEQVKADLRRLFARSVPGLQWEFPGILSDLIGDLTWSPSPIEVKAYSADTELLKRVAPEIEAELQQVDGVVDTFDGLVYTGPSLVLRVRPAEARRLGLDASDLADLVQTAMVGRVTSYVLEADRTVDLRVRVAGDWLTRSDQLLDLPLRTESGVLIKLSQVAELELEPGQLELRREDLRQDVAVTARLEGRDLGSAMAEVRRRIRARTDLPVDSIEFGGLYLQQQESLRKLLVVLVAAVFLVFIVLLVEFRSFSEPIAIVSGAVLSLAGSVAALWITGTSFNVVSFLGAIIGVGIVAKNGILMLDRVSTLRSQGLDHTEALIQSGRRRLRPVMMTSLTTVLAMLPLAGGFGTGADMLAPLAVAIIGALAFSVVLSLVATPVVDRILG